MTSQPARIEGRFAFSRRFAQESLQFRARVRIVKQRLPALIVLLRELAQLVEYGPSLSLTKLWQFLNDFRCAHGKIIASVSQNSSENFSDKKRKEIKN